MGVHFARLKGGEWKKYPFIIPFATTNVKNNFKFATDCINFLKKNYISSQLDFANCCHYAQRHYYI